MATILNKPFNPIHAPKEKIGSIILFGLFIFLFLFVFRPFGMAAINPLYKLLLVSLGFGLVTIFVLLVFKYLIEPVLVGRSWTLGKNILLDIVVASFIGAANYLYIRLIFGSPFELRFLILAIWTAILVGIIPVTIGYILTFNRLYRNALQSSSLIPDTLFPEEEIIIRAGNPRNEVRVIPGNILFLCSNDNYVTISYLNGTAVVRNTVRGTLKAAESELKKDKRFMRCHKCYIVNLAFASGIRGNSQNMTIRLRHTETEIPVSRSMAPEVASSIRKH
jgi:hypothetical protein